MLGFGLDMGLRREVYHNLVMLRRRRAGRAGLVVGGEGLSLCQIGGLELWGIRQGPVVRGKLKLKSGQNERICGSLVTDAN